MLWLPAKKKRKRLRRLARFSLRLLLFLLIFFGVGAASVPPQHALQVQIDQATASHRFDFVDWESRAITSEIQRRWSPPTIPTSEAEQRALVQTFLDHEQRRSELEHDLDQIYALCPDPTQSTCPAPQREAAAASERELTQLKAALAKITPQVETVLSRQVETVLAAEGFTLAGRVFPPVAFRFIDPPTALIISPRDRIENRYFVGLQPGLDNSRRAEIESYLDRRGDVSSYVTDIGGLGSYPTMVVNNASLTYLTEVIAHEWTHNYFFTFASNVAWGYQTYPKLTTINETTADLVGKEISRKVITRFYPDWIDRLPPLDQAGHPAPRRPSEFDLAMRRIRQRVDQLLAEGKIEEAEAYMETERLKLVEKGYNLRKLNQAYFAFHGSYALSPASIDPIGPQIRQLRAASSSLKIFLDRVGRLNSYDDYLAWLAQAGIR
jgi:hypothetical protein